MSAMRRCGASRTTPAPTTTFPKVTRSATQPTQNAEDWAAEIQAQPNPLDPVAQRFQGGNFAGVDYTPQDLRPATGSGG